MGVADDVVDSGLRSNEFGIDFDLSRREKSGHRLKSGKYLTFLGKDVMRAIDYRTITRDENGRPVPKTFDVKGQQKMIVGMERRNRPDKWTGESELFSINYKLVDAKPGEVPRTVSYPRI